MVPAAVTPDYEAMSAPPPAESELESPETAAEQAGLAHVATASFLASRIVPSGGFVVALAGGLACARAAQRAGLRSGYGASTAAMLQTVAIMGPARFGIPLTQALSAPLLGRLHARDAPVATQLAVCGIVRLVDQLLTVMLYIWVIVGGLDAFTGTYDAIFGRLGIPAGSTAALIATAVGLVAWTVFASTVQVLVYRRGLFEWPAVEARAAAEDKGGGDGVDPEAASDDASDPPTAPDDDADAPAVPLTSAETSARRRFDPRAVTLAALLAFGVLLASTRWIVLGAVALWLTLAWVTARADRGPVRAGLALAALLAFGALSFGLIGGVELDLTLRRTARAALLVLVATWLRAAAGEDGLREVARRVLVRLRRLPAAREASSIFDRLGAPGQLATSARSLLRALRDEPRDVGPLATATLGWIVAEAARFTPAHVAATAPERIVLRARWRDRALVVLAAATAVALGS